jgi:hypothetical protein
VDGEADQRDKGRTVMSKHSALDGLIAEVPFAHEGWTSERRAEFLKAFELVLDYCVPINEPTRARERDAEKGGGVSEDVEAERMFV